MVTGSASPEMRRKNFLLPVELEERINRVSRRLRKDFSQLTREALQQYVEKIEQENLERELAEGYSANAARIKAVNQDWESADAD